MRKIIFPALWILFIAGTGCNNGDQTEKKSSDSTAAKRDSGLTKTFTDPDAPNGQGTINNKSIYPKLDNTTIKVAYVYDDFMAAIKSWDDENHATAKEIYMVYAAFTLKDMDWYISTHNGVTEKIFMDSILNQPCLLMGYPDPANAGKLFYKEFGTICPPPTSCETHAMIPNKKHFFEGKGFNYPGFDPDAMIDDFIKTYDTDTKNPLTSTVKFNIDSIRNLYKAAGVKKNESIYFFMGAYDNQDAQRYVKSHPDHNISMGEIQGKTCLLFALYDPAVDKYSYFDFGTICPPDNSCKSVFR